MTGLGDTVGGKYRLERVIGEGGMGTVFEASHELLGKKVAIKLLHPEFASRPVEVERFYREAQAAASLGHHGIAEVHDVGWTDDTLPYMVMELLRGETWGQRLERSGGRLEIDHAVGLCDEMLSALIKVHRAGVVHRDLKPSNLFLAREEEGPDQLKILDFGISKFNVDSADKALTQDGAIMGTPWYMSPEQARGDSDVDHRADLWAVGAILYESLTGRRPFVGDNIRRICFEIISSHPVEPTVLRPEIHPALERVVLSALQKSRDERFQEAQTFLDELRRSAGKASTYAMLESADDGLAAAADPGLQDFDDATPTHQLRSMGTLGLAPETVETSIDFHPSASVPATVVLPGGGETGGGPSSPGPMGEHTPLSAPLSAPQDTFAAVVNDENGRSRVRKGRILLLSVGVLLFGGALIAGSLYFVDVFAHRGGGSGPQPSAAASEPVNANTSLPDESSSPGSFVAATEVVAPASARVQVVDASAPEPPSVAADPVASQSVPDTNVERPSVAAAEPVRPTTEPLSREEVEGPLDDLAPGVRRCLVRSFRRPTTIEVSLSIGADGSTELLGSTPTVTAGAAECLRELYVTATFRATGLDPLNTTHRYDVGPRRSARHRRVAPRTQTKTRSDLRNNPFGNNR